MLYHFELCSFKIVLWAQTTPHFGHHLISKIGCLVKLHKLSFTSRKMNQLATEAIAAMIYCIQLGLRVKDQTHLNSAERII